MPADIHVSQLIPISFSIESIYVQSKCLLCDDFTIFTKLRNFWYWSPFYISSIPLYLHDCPLTNSDPSSWNVHTYISTCMFRVQFAYLKHRLCCIKRVRYQDATFKDKNSANQRIIPKNLFQITLIIDDSNVFDLVSLRSTLIVFTFSVENAWNSKKVVWRESGKWREMKRGREIERESLKGWKTAWCDLN